jgi:hypothetical protein
MVRKKYIKFLPLKGILQNVVKTIFGMFKIKKKGFLVKKEKLEVLKKLKIIYDTMVYGIIHYLEMRL